MSGLVLLASYPKSGNTWLRAVLESLRRGGAPVALNQLSRTIANIAWQRLFDTAMGVDSADLTDAEIIAARPHLHRRLAATCADWPVFKVHDARLPFPPSGELLFQAGVVKAVIHVVRDPRDVAVSLANHIGRPVEDAIARMADAGRVARGGSQLPQFLSSWSAHVESWLESPDLKLFTLRYEDMKAHPEAAFGGAARFIGLDARPEALSDAIANTRFERLRAQEAAEGFVERPEACDRFFRRGEVGGWRDSLTPAQAERIVLDHGRVMRRLGYLA